MHACSEWQGHVIVCGLHGVGLRIVEQLDAAGTAVVVIDESPEPSLARAVASLRVVHLALPANDPQTLRSAGLDGAAAIACVQRDDLQTLDTALLVRELAPEARVIVSLDNPAVGRGVADLTGGEGVLDVAGLFAPSVIETCTREQRHDLDLDGERLVVAEAIVREHGSLRELFGDLAPMGVAPASDGELAVCPSRDYEVSAGDRVWLIGSAEQTDAAGLPRRSPSRGSPRQGPSRGSSPRGRTRGIPSSLRRLRRRAIALTGGPDKGLRIALAIVLAMIVGSTLLLKLTYHLAVHDHHLGLLDALYFTVETISTVGFGDFSFSGQGPWLEIYGIALILLGAAMVTTVFTLITNMLVSRRIEQSLGRARVTDMSGHTVLVGLGDIGMRVLEGLVARDEQVVVIEREESNRYLNQARGLRVPVVVGDATLRSTLELVNLRAASAVAILTSDDLTNIETGLAVRDMLGARSHEMPLVLRVFDRELGQRVQRSFHFHHVWSTSAIAAPWFIGAALGLDVLASFYVDHEPFLLARLTVASGGGLAGVAMRELSARMRVLALRRAGGELEYPPRRDTRFAPADIAYLAGPSDELLEVLRREQQAG